MKYNNRKTVVNGIEFDSKLEAKRYLELREMQRNNEIGALKMQPVYELIPSFKKNGKTYRKTTYKADFSYCRASDGKIIVEDVKGFKTDVYKLKKKMFEYRYPQLEIKEITR